MFVAWRNRCIVDDKLGLDVPLDGETNSKYGYTLQFVYAFYTTTLVGRAVYQKRRRCPCCVYERIPILATFISIPIVLLAASTVLQSSGPVNMDPTRSVPLLPRLILCGSGASLRCYVHHVHGTNRV